MGRLKFDVATLSLSLLANLLLVLFSLGRQNEVSVLRGGWFLPYPLAGKAPGKENDLDFCPLVRPKTCCGKLASNGEATQDCVNLWEYLECSICDPEIGVQSDLAPCSPRKLVCAKASDLFPNGTELCNVAGFSVLPVDPGNPEMSEEDYYRTQVSLYSIHPSWQPTQTKKTEKSEPTGNPKCEVFNEDAPSRVEKNESFYEEAPSPVRKIFLDRKVYCGMVLTLLAAGLFSLRFRKRDPNLDRIAAILRVNSDGVLKKNTKSRKKKHM